MVQLGSFEVVLLGSLEVVLLMFLLGTAEPVVMGSIKRLCMFQGSSTSSVGRPVSSPPHQDQNHEG